MKCGAGKGNRQPIRDLRMHVPTTKEVGSFPMGEDGIGEGGMFGNYPTTNTAFGHVGCWILK